MVLDLPGLLFLVVWNCALYTGWLVLCMSRPWPVAEILLVAVAGLWCQILATQLALGWLGLLTAGWLASANLLVLLSLLFLAARRLTYEQIIRHARTVRGSLRLILRSPTVVILLGLLVLWMIWTLFLGLIFPPYAFDEYYYHMPIVATILQTGHIGLIPTAIPWISAYPKNSELFVLWNSIFLYRDTFADLTMLPFALGGGLGIYAAARRLGAQIEAAVIAASVFLFAPTVMIQIKSTYNDVMIGALWAIGVCFALPPRDSRSPTPVLAVLVSGAAAGLILGIKYSGPPFVAGIGLLMAYQAIRRTGFRRSLRLLLTFGGCVLLAGSYWYIFNLVTFGNPIWPFNVRLGGRLIFAGTANSTALSGQDQSLDVIGHLGFWQRLLFAWFDRMGNFSVDSRLAGLGPLWIVIAVPSICIWAIIALLQRRLLPLIVIAVHLLVLAVIPLNWHPRYSLFLLTAGGCAIGAVYGVLGIIARRWLSILAVVLALFAVFNSLDHLYFTVDRIRMFAGLSERQRTGPRYDPLSFGPTFRWLEETVPAGSVVAYGNNVSLPYPLWGSAFERRLVAVTTTDPSRYVAELRAAGVDYVFVGIKGHQATILAADATAHRVFAGGDGWQVFAIER